MRNAAEEMNSTHQHLSALLILVVSVLALTPTLAHADQPSQIQRIAIDVTGEATAIGTGPSGATTLNLTAAAYKNSNQWLMIQNTTGFLQIGSANFAITGGHGSVSKAGAIAIFADTPFGQLILQGTTSGNSVTFQMPSQLSSASYLALSGTIGPATQQTANVATIPASTVENTTSSATIHVNATQQINVTSTSSSTPMLQNTTTEAANASSTVNANSTVQVLNTTQSSINASASTGNGTMPTPSVGVGQSKLTIHVVQGVGEICLSSRDQLPVCTTGSQTVPVANGELVNLDSDAGIGFTWDHYDGLGVGQAQNFNANVTQDNAVGVYFSSGLAGAGNVTTALAVSAPANSMTTPVSSMNITSQTVNTPDLGDSTATVSQYVTQTVSVTQTVANVTINRTVTTTVGNVTVTQANVTITVNATTNTSGP